MSKNAFNIHELANESNGLRMYIYYIIKDFLGTKKSCKKFNIYSKRSVVAYK